jgi:hypothetical protein
MHHKLNTTVALHCYGKDAEKARVQSAIKYFSVANRPDVDVHLVEIGSTAVLLLATKR